MDPSLERLARACGVATEYEDWAHRPVSVSEEMVGHKFGEFSPTRTFHGHSGDKKAKKA